MVVAGAREVKVLRGQAKERPRVVAGPEVRADRGIELAVRVEAAARRRDEGDQRAHVHGDVAADPVGVVRGAHDRMAAQRLRQPLDPQVGPPGQGRAARVTLTHAPEPVARRPVRVAVPGVGGGHRVRAVQHQRAQQVRVPHGEHRAEERAVGVAVQIDLVDPERGHDVGEVVSGRRRCRSPRRWRPTDGRTRRRLPRSCPRTTAAPGSRSPPSPRSPGCRPSAGGSGP